MFSFWFALQCFTVEIFEKSTPGIFATSLVDVTRSHARSRVSHPHVDFESRAAETSAGPGKGARVPKIWGTSLQGCYWKNEEHETWKAESAMKPFSTVQKKKKNDQQAATFQSRLKKNRSLWGFHLSSECKVFSPAVASLASLRRLGMMRPSAWYQSLMFCFSHW